MNELGTGTLEENVHGSITVCCARSEPAEYALGTGENGTHHANLMASLDDVVLGYA